MVLLVEDDDNMRAAVARILDHSGIQVVSAADYSEGTAYIQNARFDIIVSDYHMPYGSGLMLYEELRRMDLNTPFVLVSGDMRVTISDQKFRFLSKPFTSVALIDTLRPFLSASRCGV